MFLAIKVAKQGYFNNNPIEVLDAPVDIVMATLNYELMELEYLECSRYLTEVNK